MKTISKRLLTLFVISLTVILVMTSCEDDDGGDPVAPPNEELDAQTIALVEETALTESVEEEINQSVEEAVAYSEDSAVSIPTCATITVTPEGKSFPKTITIDYGDGCESITGITRKGSITITISDTLRNSGASYSITLNNYMIEGILVTGNKTVENTGTKDAPSFSETVDFTLTTPDGTVIEKTKNTSRQWIEGMDTYALFDDVFLISGSAQVTSSAGRSYSYTITEPLKVSRSCSNVLSGVIEVTWSGQDEPVTIDFGEGICDLKVYVSRGRRIIRRQLFIHGL